MVVHGPFAQTRFCSLEHSRAGACPTPHTVQSTHVPSAFPPQPELYFPAAHVLQAMQFPSDATLHCDLQYPGVQPPDEQGAH